MDKRKRSIGHIKNLGDGRYVLRVSNGFDDYGHRHQPSKTVNATSDTDAERKLIAFSAEVKKGGRGSNKGDPQTLKELYTEFDENHIAALRSNTKDFYHRIWDSHLADYGKIKLAKITPKHVRDIINNSGAGDRYKKAIYGMLNTMFRFATIDNEYMVTNPCDKVKAPKYEAKEKKVLTEDETKHIVELVSKESLERQLSFILGVVCGMRREEIMALEWSNINIKNRHISIQQAAARSEEKGEYIDKPKNKKSIRALALPVPAVPVLLALRVEQSERREMLGDKWSDNDFVFKGLTGERMSVEFPTHWWKKFRDNNHIAENVTFHGLRHTAATYMILHHVPVSTLSGILGHAQISTTTDIYSHVIEDSQKAITDMSARVFSEKK